MQRCLETLSFFVLIAVTALRPLVAETYDSSGNPFTSALPDLTDPTPLRTLAFDLAILAAALGWLVARAIGRARPYRRVGLEWGAALVLIAAVVSCLFAGNQRLAFNATVDWLCYPLLAITLAQLLHRSEYRRVLLAAILASACVQAFYCAEQYWVGFDDTWEHYQSIREQFWADQGVDLDSGNVESFEQRVLAHEATGTLPHSNVTGSYLVLCGLAALGVAVAGWRNIRVNRKQRADLAHWVGAIGATIIAAALLGAVLLTKSKGAIASAGVALALWIVLWAIRPWFQRKKIKALTIGWAVLAVGGCAVVAHGLWHDSLPGVSLTFRWQYWKASAQMVADHPLTGVGRENFGRHYLAYKAIESPEEVSNPHSFLAQAATDWGVLGLLGMGLMVIGVSYAVVRSSTETNPRAGPVAQADSDTPWMLWGFGLVLIVATGQWLLLGIDDANLQYYKTVTTALVWSLGFACFAIALKRGAMAIPTNSASLHYGAAMGLFAFAVHDTINFALFIPGTATTAFALLALCVADRSGEEKWIPTAPAPRRWIPPTLVATVALMVMLLGVIPVARSGSKTVLGQENARMLRGGPLERQLVAFSEAIYADPLDPTPCMRRAEWLMAVASWQPDRRDEALRLAEASLDQAISRDPFHLKLRRMRVDLRRAKAGASARDADHHAAVDAAREALELYPQDPKGLVLLADCLHDAGRSLESGTLLQDAVDTYRQALDLDDQRLPWERLRRFRERERRDIKARSKKAFHTLRTIQP